MKFRVIDLENGDEIQPANGHDFILFDDGSLGELDHLGSEVGGLLTPLHNYAIEFAFKKDEENQWVWEHAVIR